MKLSSSPILHKSQLEAMTPRELDALATHLTETSLIVDKNDALGHVQASLSTMTDTREQVNGALVYTSSGFSKEESLMPHDMQDDIINDPTQALKESGQELDKAISITTSPTDAMEAVGLIHDAWTSEAKAIMELKNVEHELKMIADAMEAMANDPEYIQRVREENKRTNEVESWKGNLFRYVDTLGDTSTENDNPADELSDTFPKKDSEQSPELIHGSFTTSSQDNSNEAEEVSL